MYLQVVEMIMRVDEVVVVVDEEVVVATQDQAEVTMLTQGKNYIHLVQNYILFFTYCVLSDILLD